MNEHRVTAIDQFGRVFNHSYFCTEFLIEDIDPAVYGWLFRRAVYDILKQMGEAAWAEWTAEINPYPLFLSEAEPT